MKTLPTLLGLALLAPVSSAQGWLDAPRLLEIAEGGESRQLGDWEGDGDKDLAWFEGAPGSWTGMRVLFNDGAGEFTSGPLTPLTGNRWPYTEKLRDLTGDGVTDVLIQQRTLADGFGVEVWPGLAGGGFDVPHLIPFSVPPEDVAVGDADGDGDFELAVRTSPTGLSSEPQTIRWWDFRQGTFVGSSSVVLPGTSGGAGVADVQAVDLGDDGIDDLVAGELVGDRLIALPTGGGAPTLGPAAILPLPETTGRIYPLVGDLDGDGDDDVVCSIQSSTLFVVAVEQDGGALVPAAAQEFGAWSWIDKGRPSAVGDWDADGDLDVLSHTGNASSGSTRGTLVILENDGAHVFTETAAILTGTSGSDAEPGAGLADLDGDGRLDYAAIRSIAFGNGRIEDVLQQDVGGFLPSVSAAAAVDFEGDGDLDVAFRASPFFGSQLLANDAAGELSFTGALPPAPAEHQYARIAAVGDFDGFAGPDLLIELETVGEPFDPPVFVEMRLLAAELAGGFTDVGTTVPAGELLVPSTAGLLPAVDVDGDGDLDLLDRHGPSPMGGWWENDGAGHFSAFAPLFDGEPLLALDVEGDGDLDVVSWDSSPARLDLQRNGGGLLFTAETIHTGTLETGSPALFDADGDGDSDLVLGGALLGGPVNLAVYENDGGAFVLRATPVADPSSDDALGADDVDGDGLVDLFAARGTGGGVEPDRLLVYRATAPFVYEPGRAFVSRRVVGYDDLDGDGDLDPWGQDVVRSRRFDGPADGAIQQYGSGGAGTGGAVPLLGASGPLRPGSTSASLRLRRGLASSIAWIAVGTGPTELVGFPFPDFTLYVDGLLLLQPVPVAGPLGVPGAGELTVLLDGLVGSLAGLSLTHQFLAIDPGATGGISFSNGLALTYGL